MRRRGIDEPSARVVTWYNKRNFLGTGNAMPVEEATYLEQMALAQVSILTKSDETTIGVLRASGYRKEILQYVLFTEVGSWATDSSGAFTSTAPRNNNWCFGSIPWRTALEYDATAWLHLAPATSGAGAAAGAGSVPVSDLSRFQVVGSGSRGIVDVWSSGGTYLGCFHYIGMSGSSGSGTLTVPTTGYGSIGFVPTSLAGVGATNPQTGAAWVLPTLASIPAGAVLRGRVRTGAVSGSTNAPQTSNHHWLGDPTSAAFRNWLKAAYLAYVASSPGGSGPTDEWDGIFLDNLHTNAEKFTGNTSSTYGNTPGFVLPTPIGGSTWTNAQWDAAHVALIAWMHANLPGVVLWGNTYPNEFGTTAPEGPERDAQIAQCVAYAGAGLAGGMLEAFPTKFTSGAISYMSRAEFDNGLAYADALIAADLNLILVSQGAATQGWLNTDAGRFAAAACLLVQDEDGHAHVRFTNYASGTYPQWWPVTEYHLRLGKPVGARVRSGTDPVVYTRDFERGRASISYPASGTPVATIVGP
jgi:hypothetical protein